MNKIGIIGGSFDPIHCGHLILAEQARVEGGLSQVVFMPAFVSPFKQNTKAADAENRLEMVQLATENNPYFRVSQAEIGRGQVSYTASTLKQYQKELGTDAELWFITGTDAFLSIENWYESEYLLSHFSFAVGLRPGFPEAELDCCIERINRRYGTKVKKILTPQVDISSSLVRDLITTGKSARYLIPDAVLDYIVLKGLYIPQEIESGYEAIKSQIEASIKKDLKASRLAHTKGVAEEAQSLAVRYGADKEKAELCGLFHDCRRGEGSLEHGPLAAERMEQEYHITDEDMLNAVKYHTTGRADMSLLEKILYLADAIEPTRQYPGVERLRKLAYEDLNGACLLAMENSIQYVRDRGLCLDENTVKARDFLEKRRKYE